MKTKIQTTRSRQEVVQYFIKTMRHYRNKEILAVSFNTVNHWITLSISTNYNQVWYCDFSRPTYPITSDRLTHDWTDIMAVLNE
jgi:hypothetical protein